MIIAEDIKAESPVPQNMSNSESGRQGYGRGTTYEEQRINSIEIKRRIPAINTGSPMLERVESRKSEGGYFFNNWRSYERYVCEKAIHSSLTQESTDNLAAHLVYAVIDMDYEKGLRIIEKINDIGTIKDIKVIN